MSNVFGIPLVYFFRLLYSVVHVCRWSKKSSGDFWWIDSYWKGQLHVHIVVCNIIHHKYSILLSQFVGFLVIVWSLLFAISCIQFVDLPCIVEAHKTLDKKTLYKTGDLSQVNNTICVLIIVNVQGNIQYFTLMQYWDFYLFLYTLVAQCIVPTQSNYVCPSFVCVKWWQELNTIITRVDLFLLNWLPTSHMFSRVEYSAWYCECFLSVDAGLFWGAHGITRRTFRRSSFI